LHFDKIFFGVLKACHAWTHMVEIPAHKNLIMLETLQ
jgi:hypothetical protein